MTEKNKLRNREILKQYCPQNLKNEQIVEITQFLKQEHKITYKEIAKHIGISESHLIRIMKKNKKHNKENS